MDVHAYRREKAHVTPSREMPESENPRNTVGSIWEQSSRLATSTLPRCLVAGPGIIECTSTEVTEPSRPNLIKWYLNPLPTDALCGALRPAEDRRCAFGQNQNRERGRLDVLGGAAGPPGDRACPRRRGVRAGAVPGAHLPPEGAEDRDPPLPKDRKSTRLNSSPSQSSHAVFCLQKKTRHLS